MKICSCDATEETGERLEAYMPDELKKKKIALNLGYSEFKDIDGYKTLNPSWAVKNCVDKKKMFELFNKHRIKSLGFVDLNTIGKTKSFFLLLFGKKLVLRKGKRLKVIGFSKIKELFKDWDYTTIKEDKLLEYRVIVFKDKIIRAMVKINKNNSFELKQENCKFIDVDINRFDEEIKENIIKSVKCIGLDLAGVDILINKNGEFKIIECNSGLAMVKKSIELFYKEMLK